MFAYSQARFDKNTISSELFTNSTMLTCKYSTEYFTETTFCLTAETEFKLYVQGCKKTVLPLKLYATLLSEYIWFLTDFLFIKECMWSQC